MKKYRLEDLQVKGRGHVLQGILPGEYISSGGLSFAKPGDRSHSFDGPDGSDYHVHHDCEAFVLLQGTGQLEIDKVFHPVGAGDVIVVEPGENHHLISSVEDPLVVIWCHAGTQRHPSQL